VREERAHVVEQRGVVAVAAKQVGGGGGIAIAVAAAPAIGAAATAAHAVRPGHG